MNQIISFSERLYKVKTTTDCFLVIVGKGCREMTKRTELFELCRSIVELESEGRIVTSVTALCPDGSTPRVSFRYTPEYHRAKKEKEEDNENLGR